MLFFQKEISKYLFLWAGMVLVFLISPKVSAEVNSKDSASVKKINTIIVDNYYPYTFVNKNGNPDGFSVDLIKAVTKVMGMELGIHAGAWEQAKESLIDGSIDFLPMMAYSKERDTLFDFSVPHTIAYDAFFIRNNSIKISTMDDLKGKTVIVMKDDQAHDYLRVSGLIEPENLIFIKSIPEALRLLASGKGDAALMPKIVGLIAIKDLGLKNLVPSPAVIEAYNRPFSFSVKEGNQLLLERLNQGLSIVKATNQYGEIYEKWFGAIEPKELPFEAVFKYILMVFFAFVLIGLALTLWSISLRKQVAVRTRDLEDEILVRKRAEEALKESETHLRTLLRTIPDLVWLKDPQGIYLSCNSRFESLYGAKEKDIIGKTDYDFVDKQLADFFRKHDKMATAKGIPSVNEEELTFADDGHREIIETIKTPMYRSDGQLAGVLGIGRNITDRKQIEIRNKESESRFRELFENMYDGVAVYAAENDGNDFRFVDINLSGQFLSKVKREDVIGKSVTELFPSIKEIGLFEVFQRVYRTGKTERLPMTQYKDGRILQWVDNTVFKLPSGEIVAVYKDESERHVAEEALKESGMLLNEVGKIAKIGGWEMDLVTRKAKWTQGTYDIVEIDYDQPVPGPDEHIEYYLSEYRSLVSDSMQTLIEDDRPLDFEAQLQSAKGNIKWCRAMGRTVKKEGRCVKVYGTFQDITDRKNAEEEIRELNRNLELRVHQRTVQLEEANKELEDFVYSVSHDLRAPLRSISGFAEIINRRHKSSLNEEGRHYFDNIVKASGQMGDLIDDLLKFSRLGRKAIQSENVSLDDLFKTAVATLSDQIKKSGARVNLPEQMPVVQGDMTLATHIFINLLENAVKYHQPHEPPLVDVGFEVEDPYVVVSVADNGIGIAPEYHEKIFNIFQRLHSQADYPGTGIGLAAVKKAVQIMAGRVWVESEPGKGSVFKIKVLMATTA